MSILLEDYRPIMRFAVDLCGFVNAKTLLFFHFFFNIFTYKNKLTLQRDGPPKKLKK